MRFVKFILKHNTSTEKSEMKREFANAREEDITSISSWRFIIVLIVAVVIFISLESTKNSNKSITSMPAKKTEIKNPQYQISTGQIPNFPFKLPNSFVIHIFASGLGNPRVLTFSPGGTLLVSVPSSNQVIALPDKDRNGVADSEKIVVSGENHVHGLSFYKGKLFIADVDRVVRYNWNEENLQATFDKVLFNLPENNDHNNRTIAFDKQGNMYISVGSTCNVCHENDHRSATVMISNENGDNPRIFATGLRNAAFTAINPLTNELWGTEMGRDYLGDDIPPDEINIIKQNNNYGWPNCYGNKIPDLSFNPNANCSNTIAPIYGIPAHSAPLGLVFINSQEFPRGFQNDLLVAYHGSWNRTTPTGYKVVHLTVKDNSITSSQDFLTGFLPSDVLNGPNNAYGRPVDLVFDTFGNLYISDDKAGNIYIIQKNLN